MRLGDCVSDGCRSPLANQMRLILHTAAYWLIRTALHTAIYDPGLILLVSPSLRQSKELFAKVTGFLQGSRDRIGRACLPDDLLRPRPGREPDQAAQGSARL